jgi:predicted ATP-grasp superfamily ATP-dependent carboligase
MQNQSISKYKVLLLDGGRQVLPFLSSFRNAGHHTAVVCSSVFCEGYFSRYPDRKLVWPSPRSNPQGFRNSLLQYLQEEPVDFIIGVSDFSTRVLSENKHLVQKYAHCLIPDHKIFDLATDKLKLMDFCMSHGIPCPKTYPIDLNEIDGSGLPLKFPVVLKPRRSVGSLGFAICRDFDEVVATLKRGELRYGKFLIQEYIPSKQGHQYQAVSFSDENGKARYVVVVKKTRFFPTSGGTGSATITVKDEAIEKAACGLLEKIGWIGASDIDFIVDGLTGEAKVIEINPRVPANVKIAFEAGVDFAELYTSVFKGEVIAAPGDYRLNVCCRNFFLEMLWFLFSTRRMKKETIPPFFKVRGYETSEQIFSLRDPLPFFGFFIGSLVKYADPKKLNEKARKR